MSTVRQGDCLVFVGDSITFQGWMDDATDEINATIPVRLVGAGTVSGGTRATVVGLPAAFTPAELTPTTIVNSGVSQNRAADIAAATASRITNYGPNHVIVEVGRNDVDPPVEPFTPTTLISFRASYDAILDAIVAANPATSITCLSILLDHECWAAGPVWDNFFDPGVANPAYTPSIAQFNTEIQASCLAHGGTYVDFRGPALAYEAANNTPAPGAQTGVLTLDGTHLNATGAAMASALYMATVTVVP